MNRLAVPRTIAAVLAFAAIPVLWVFGRMALPAASAVMTAKSGDTIGVWLFTWALIVVAMVAALTIGVIACLPRSLDISDPDAAAQHSRR